MSGKSGLTVPAKVYVGAILCVAAGLTAGGLLPLTALQITEGQWLAFAVLAGCAATAQLFPVVTPKHQAYYVTVVFVFAGLLILPPALLSLLIIIAFVPEWIKVRYPWHIQLFNIANFLIDGHVARQIYILLDGESKVTLDQPSDMFSAVAAACAFALINHFLLAIVLYLARKHSIRESGLFDMENILTDATLASTGVITALLWQSSPLLIGVIAAPLFLIRRALNTPNLEEQARTDGKTGLYNARHFYQMLQEELRRAGRFDRPLAVIMADMDLLRNINNTYGHLAGDVVLKGVADIIRGGLREYDMAARFGGEEFAILLPESSGEQALAVAERLRKEVEGADFVVTTCAKPIRATLSLGVASYPANGKEANEVIHQADLAVYYAKLKGRNRAWACSPESMALGEKVAGRGDLAVLLESDGQPQSYASVARPVETVYEETPDQDRIDKGTGGRIGGSGHSAEPTQAGSSGEKNNAPPPETKAPEGHTHRTARVNRRERSSDLPWSVAALVGAVVALAAALYVAVRPWEARLDWYGLVCLAVLAIGAQGMAIDIYGRGKISMAAIVVLASGLLFDVPGVLLLAPVIAVATRVLRGGMLYRTAFDAGNTALAGATAVFVHNLVLAASPNREPIWHVVPAIAAATCYYVVNIGLLSIAMGWSERQSPWAVWKERFRWLWPHYVVYGGFGLVIALGYQAIGVYGIISFFVPPFMLRFVMKQYIDRTEDNVIEVKRVNQELVQAHRETNSALEQLRETYGATLRALSAALDSRDSEIEGHSHRVVEYALAIARGLGLPLNELQGLQHGALLHDIGKIGVPDAILRKPGPLSEEEWAVMRTHPVLGCQMLKQIGFLSDALPVVKHHHERFDGGGYPDGLSGEAIPIAARIFAVADTFDAMTSDRPYRKGCSHEKARAEIARCVGSQFDPQIVAAFLKLEAQELNRLAGKAKGEEMAPHEEKATQPLPQLHFVVPAA